MALSLARQFRDKLDCITVPVAIETLLYQSSQRSVLISFDFVICNHSPAPVDTFLTHLDDVDAWLATTDWMDLDRSDHDERAALVQQVYGPGIQFDPDNGRFAFVDPIMVSDEPHAAEDAVQARALDYGQPDGQQNYLEAGPLGICPDESFQSRQRLVYQLQKYPEMTPMPHGDAEGRLFSSFRLSGIPPARDAGCAFVRITLQIADQAYGRLVEPQDGAAFSVVSSRRVLGQIEQRFEKFTEYHLARSPDFGTFYSFYQEQIQDAVIDPERYHIIIGQPHAASEDKCIRYRPASGTLSERYVIDPEARKQALWFSAWSPDFTLVLAYGGAQDGRSFRQRLPADIAAL